MRFKGFIGPSYTLQSINFDCQRCINLYPEMDETQTGNEGEVADLVSTPGLRLLVTLPTGPVRGVYCDSLGNLWAVGGSVVYQISSLWSATVVGKLKTYSGAVSFSDNGNQAILVDGPNGYYWNLNLQAASPPPGYTSTVTSGGTTTLSNSSFSQQYFTGSQTQTIVLPVATTMVQGQGFNIVNLSSQSITVQTSGGNTLVSIATNQQASVICSDITGGTGTASWTDTVTAISSNSFTQISDPSFYGANLVLFFDSYFIFNKPGTQRFYLSPLNAITPFNGLDYASSESHPDPLIGFAAIQENLYLFSQRHMEVWYDSGNNSFPFERIQGAVFEIGCAAAFSIQTIQMGVYWLGRDKDGHGTVYCAQGLQPQRISTYAIENEIQKLGDLSNARAWTYFQSGHFFYCLNIPGSDSTFVFDTTTNLWHERAYLSSQGVYERHLADCHAFAFNTNVVGDYSSSNIYSLDQTVMTDNGSAISRERVSPHLSDNLNRIFHSRFWLDMEMGLGLDWSVQGSNPQVMLQWSNDWGHSWSNEHWVSAGVIGARHARAIFRRLGMARDRVYRVRITDPIKVTLLGAEIDIEEGSS